MTRTRASVFCVAGLADGGWSSRARCRIAAVFGPDWVHQRWVVDWVGAHDVGYLRATEESLSSL